MALVTKALESGSLVTDATGDQITCQQKRDEKGALQVRVTAGSCTEVLAEGRLTSDGDWHELATTGAMSSSTVNKKLLSDLPILPYMRARMVGGPCTSLAFLME